MKLRVLLLSAIFLIITMTALLFKSVSVAEGYNYEKYDPTIIAFQNSKHTYA